MSYKINELLNSLKFLSFRNVKSEKFKKAEINNY